MEETEDIEEQRREIYDTMEEERCLLKLLFSNIMMSKKYFSQVNAEVFTSDLRLWLFRTSYRIFKESRGKFEESVLNAELDRVKEIYIEKNPHKSKFKKKEKLSHKNIKIEFNMIMGSSSSHSPEWLIKDLEKKLRAKRFMESAEEAVDEVLSGNSDEAISKLNSDLIKIKSNIFTEKPLRKLSDASWQIKGFKNKQEHPELYSCLKTGFDSFDRKAGLYKGEITLIMAHTGVGKSTLMRSMALGAAEIGLNVLFIVNEEIEEQAGNKISSMYLSCINPKFSYRRLKKADEKILNKKGFDFFKDGLSEFGKSMGEIYIQELPHFHTCADIEQILIELEEQGQRIDVLFLDYLDHLKPMEKSWSEYDEQNKSIAEFKNICMQFRVAGVTATQADTASVEMDDMNPYNVRGSKQKSGASNIVLAIKELKTSYDDKNGDEEEGSMGDITWRVMITKNRDGPKFSFYSRFYKSTGIVREFGDSRMSEEDLECMKEDIENFKSGMPGAKSKITKKEFTKDISSIIASDGDSKKTSLKEEDPNEDSIDEETLKKIDLFEN